MSFARLYAEMGRKMTYDRSLFRPNYVFTLCKYMSMQLNNASPILKNRSNNNFVCATIGIYIGFLDNLYQLLL